MPDLDPSTPPSTEKPKEGDPPQKGYPPKEVFLALKSDAEKYAALKNWHLNDNTEDTLCKFYHRAIRISQYLGAFRNALLAFQHRMEARYEEHKEDKWLRNVIILCDAIDDGLLKFWNAVNTEANKLLATGRWNPAVISFASGLDIITEVPSEAVGGTIPTPVPLPGKDAAQDLEVLGVLFGVLSFVSNHSTKLSEVGPRMGFSYSELLVAVQTIGMKFWEDYNNPNFPPKRGDRLITPPHNPHDKIGHGDSSDKKNDSKL